MKIKDLLIEANRNFFDLGMIEITAAGHRLNGKKGFVFHRFSDGKINAQIQNSSRKGDVTNLTLSQGEYKEINESTLLESVPASPALIDSFSNTKITLPVFSSNSRDRISFVLTQPNPTDFFVQLMNPNRGTIAFPIDQFDEANKKKFFKSLHDAIDEFEDEFDAAKKKHDMKFQAWIEKARSEYEKQQRKEE